MVAFQKELFNDKVLFCLQKFASQWRGKKFSELDERDKFKFATASDLKRSFVVRLVTLQGKKTKAKVAQPHKDGVA